MSSHLELVHDSLTCFKCQKSFKNSTGMSNHWTHGFVCDKRRAARNKTDDATIDDEAKEKGAEEGVVLVDTVANEPISEEVKLVYLI